MRLSTHYNSDNSKCKRDYSWNQVTKETVTTESTDVT